MEWNRTGDYRVSIKQDANVLPLELPTYSLRFLNFHNRFRFQANTEERFEPIPTFHDYLGFQVLPFAIVEGFLGLAKEAQLLALRDHQHVGRARPQERVVRVQGRRLEGIVMLRFVRRRLGCLRRRVVRL